MTMAVDCDAKPQHKQTNKKGYKALRPAYGQRKDSHRKDCVSEAILVY